MLKIAPYLFYTKRDDVLYIKNLHSPLNGIIKLNPGETKKFQKFLNDKKILNLGVKTILKFTLLDILIFKWRKASNYSMKYLNKEKHDKITFWIHLTNNCNFACKYCYIYKTPEDIEDKVLKRLPELIYELKSKGYKTIKYKFAGGEPLLKFNILKTLFYKLEKTAQKLNIKTEYTIISNGSLISKDIINFLKSNPKIRLAVSLDGIGKDHDANRIFKNGKGTFNTVSKNIDLLLKNGIAPYLSVTVTDKSVKNLPKLFKFINKRHLNFSLNIVRAFDTTDHIEDKNQKDQSFINSYIQAIRLYEKYLSPYTAVTSTFSDRTNLNQAHIYTCSIERNYIVVDHKGNLFKCQMLISTKNTIGTIFDNDWLLKVQNPAPKQKLNISVEEKTYCNNCKWKYLCSGGCPLTTYFENQDPRARNPLCSFNNRVLPEILELEITRIHKFKRYVKNKRQYGKNL